MWKKYLFTDSLSSFSSMTGSFWILFLLRFAEGVFGNKLILLTGLEQRWFKFSFNSVIFIWNINTYIPSSKQQTSYNSKTVYESFIECMYAVVSSCFSDILKLGLGPLEIFIVHWTYRILKIYNLPVLKEMLKLKCLCNLNFLRVSISYLKPERGWKENLGKI